MTEFIFSNVKHASHILYGFKFSHAAVLVNPMPREV